jgi:hypothetical protein
LIVVLSGKYMICAAASDGSQAIKTAIGQDRQRLIIVGTPLTAIAPASRARLRRASVRRRGLLGKLQPAEVLS